MHASSVLALAAAGFAAAAPVTQTDFAVLPDAGVFNIFDFSYGCTVGCDWSFNVTITPGYEHHPVVANKVECKGGWGYYRPGSSPPPFNDYFECGPVIPSLNDPQQVFAFIDRETSVLNLKYVVSETAEAAVYTYIGNTTVFPATSPNAKFQPETFGVPETTLLAVGGGLPPTPPTSA